MIKSKLIYKEVNKEQFKFSHKDLIKETKKVQSGRPTEHNNANNTQPKQKNKANKIVRFKARVAVLFYDKKNGEVIAAGCKHIDKKEIVLLKKKVYTF